MSEYKEYYDYGVCKSCGGTCCQRMACAYMPSDFEILRTNVSDDEKVYNLLQLAFQGVISIDYLPGEDVFGPLEKGKPSMEKIEENYGCLYLIAPTKGRGAIYFKTPDMFYIPEPCALWDAQKGCLLPEEKRPTGGKTLEPKVVGGNRIKCITHLKQDDYYLAWTRENYQEILFRLYERLA